MHTVGLSLPAFVRLLLICLFLSAERTFTTPLGTPLSWISGKLGDIRTGLGTCTGCRATDVVNSFKQPLRGSTGEPPSGDLVRLLEPVSNNAPLVHSFKQPLQGSGDISSGELARLLESVSNNAASRRVGAPLHDEWQSLMKKAGEHKLAMLPSVEPKAFISEKTIFNIEENLLAKQKSSRPYDQIQEDLERAEAELFKFREKASNPNKPRPSRMSATSPSAAPSAQELKSLELERRVGVLEDEYETKQWIDWWIKQAEHIRSERNPNLAEVNMLLSAARKRNSLRSLLSQRPF